MGLGSLCSPLKFRYSASLSDLLPHVSIPLRSFLTPAATMSCIEKHADTRKIAAIRGTVSTPKISKKKKHIYKYNYIILSYLILYII